MRPTPNALIEKYRRVHPTLGASPVGTDYGYFEVNGMRIISSGSGRETDRLLTEWEHVSISLPKRVPTWAELCFVKSLFWSDDETVLQFHPKKPST